MQMEHAARQRAACSIAVGVRSSAFVTGFYAAKHQLLFLYVDFLEAM